MANGTEIANGAKTQAHLAASFTPVATDTLPSAPTQYLRLIGYL